jgi:hypothetical protein
MPPPGGGNPPPAPRGSNWYENVAVVIIALLCCTPLGLVLVWLNKQWTTKTKWIVTAVILALAVLGGVAAAVGGASSEDSQSEEAPSATTTTEATPTTASTTQAAPTTAEPTTTAAAPAATCVDTPADQSFDSKGQNLYPGRIGAQDDDHEAAVGDCVRIGGLSVFVNGARTDSVEYLAEQLVVVDVVIQNRDDEAKPFNIFDWKMQLASGQIVDPSFITPDGDQSLSSGEIAAGGQAAGVVTFEAPPGEYYVIYQPSFSLSSDRGLWKVTV